MRINSLDALNDTLIYPVLHHDGTQGYSENIQFTTPIGGGPRRRGFVTPMQFYRHRLQCRDYNLEGPIEHDAVFANARLTQEYICHVALKIQEIRLKHLANLQDRLHGRRENLKKINFCTETSNAIQLNNKDVRND